MTSQDTKQQRAILRQNKAARWVRKTYPAGTRVTSAHYDGLPVGVVKRHVPHSNAQGGVLVVEWENGHVGRVSPGSVKKVEAKCPHCGVEHGMVHRVQCPVVLAEAEANREDTQ
jgi:hypothetical protein